MWCEEQRELLAVLRGRPLDLSGDGRCDSPGFSAKYLSYSLHESQADKIVHTVQIEVGEVPKLLQILMVIS